MLDWEQRIAQWRQALAQKLGPDPEILDELESHLRDEIDRLVRQGQVREEAVLSAIAKIGPPEKLAQEFARVARPWWPIRIVLSGTLLAAAGALALVGFRFGQGGDRLLLVHVAAVTVGYLLSYGIGMLAVCYALRRMVRDLAAGQRLSWTRALTHMTLLAFIFTAIGFALGGTWAHAHLGHFWNWDPREIGAVLTMLWQAILLGSAWRWTRRVRWLLCWGLLGNVTVTFAWFVAGVLAAAQQLHSYGFNQPKVVILFVVIVITHGLLMAAAIAPGGWLRLRKATS
jgi:cytochrome c assembly protein